MGLIKTAAKAAVASSVHGRVQRRQQARWAEQDRLAAADQHQPAVAAAPAPTDVREQIALLTQLGELRDSGVLTEAEYEVKKAAVLGG